MPPTPPQAPEDQRQPHRAELPECQGQAETGFAEDGIGGEADVAAVLGGADVPPEAIGIVGIAPVQGGIGGSAKRQDGIDAESHKQGDRSKDHEPEGQSISLPVEPKDDGGGQ